jgi:hypothetical protein
MKFSLPSFARWRSGAFAAVNRFPWIILCGVTGAVCLIITIHTEHNDWLEGQCARLAMAATLGMPLFFALRMVRERTESLKRWPIELLGFVLLALWITAQPARPGDGPGIIWIRWLFLLAALHFLVAISAYVGRPQRSGFWQFNRRLFLRFCLATLYTVVLTGGLELALLSADKLFELKLGKSYADLFFVMIGVFHPAFFLSDVPSDFQALDQDVEYPRGLKAFTQFALAPLVAVYTAILYAYAIKIIITRSWPHGWVALPVLLLSGIGILAFLLLYPLRTQPKQQWALWFTQNFPRALAPLSILLLLSVQMRIRQYGVTEERYVGVAAALWIFSWALVFIFRGNPGILWIPSSLAIIALIATFGPVSAGAISRANQLKRVEHMLQAHGLWQDNHARPAATAKELSKAAETDLQSTLSYLIQTHGGESVHGIFDQIVSHLDWKNLTGWQGSHEILDSLRIVTHNYGVVAASVSLISVGRDRADTLNIEGFRNLCRIQLFETSQGDWRPITCNGIAIGNEDGVLKLAAKNEASPQPLQLDTLLNALPLNDTNALPADKLTLNFRRGPQEFRIVFDYVSFRRDAERFRVVSCQLYLMEK